MELSTKQIGKDTEAYQRRLSRVQQRLDALPPKGRIPSEGRKLKATRRQLEAEIKHIETLIGYAQDALVDRGGPEPARTTVFPGSEGDPGGVRTFAPPPMDI